MEYGVCFMYEGERYGGMELELYTWESVIDPDIHILISSTASMHVVLLVIKQYRSRGMLAHHADLTERTDCKMLCRVHICCVPLMDTRHPWVTRQSR